MLHILLYDDPAGHALARALTRLILRRAGFAVTTVADGKSAVEEFRRCKPDLVVCGLFLHQTSGLEVIRMLCREPPAAKVIAIAGCDGDEELLEAARLSGAAEVIGEPAAPALLDAVRRVLQAV